MCNDVTINENLTNSDVDFTVLTLEKDHEFPTMADVSIVCDDFDGNELCSTHINTEENFREMSNDMPLASNEESTTGSASHLNELIQYTDKREKLQEERFSVSVLQKIEDDYHSKSKDKSATVEFLLEVFGDMVFENHFLSWLSKRINARSVW